MLAVLGLIFGIVVGVLIDPTVPTWLQPFLPVAVVAGLDALLGAGRAWLEGTFQDRVFVMSFFWNVVVACLLVFLGTQLGVGSAMTTAVVVVLGIRIFSNTASIRRLILTAGAGARPRKRAKRLPGPRRVKRGRRHSTTPR